MVYHLFYNVIILLFLSTISHGDEAGGIKLTSAEDAELNRQLKSLNKPPIKSFELNGDIIDCVDIYKQPAFDHPLLKNHKHQRRPSFVPRARKLRREDSRVNRQISESEFEGCPNGSVPFKRTQKKDLIMAKAMIDIRRSRTINPTSGLTPEMHYAAITTQVNHPPRLLYGGSTAISVYNLTVQSPQLTEAMLWIGNAVDGPYNSIEFGWMVNPQLYGDVRPRTYSMWTADGLQNTGCYNVQCPGYVQVSKTRLMGAVITKLSTFGGETHDLDFKLFKDRKTSNWWLVEIIDGMKQENVGYWPKELFPRLHYHATIVQIGGKVYNPKEVPQPGPMGSGTFIANDPQQTCHASNILFMDSNSQFLINLDDVPIQVLADDPNTYKAQYLGDVSKQHPQLKYTVIFGGPIISG